MGRIFWLFNPAVYMCVTITTENVVIHNLFISNFSKSKNLADLYFIS